MQIENEDDARLAIVSTVQGLILGSVRAAPPWHRTPHTLYMRTAIRALHRRRLIHLSSTCDAVEELIRFSESQPGSKLPPHPAYLEARRVLQQHVEQLEETAQPRLQPSTGALQQPGEPVADAVAEPAPATTPQARSKLPAMQMAKVW